jgi:hypothetical protein
MDRKKNMTKRIYLAARALTIAMIAALLALIMAQGALAGYWPMFGHDAAHSGVADEVVMPPLEVLWKYQTGSYYVDSSAAVSGGVVYVGSKDNSIYALDANTGVLKWKYQTGSFVV